MKIDLFSSQTLIEITAVSFLQNRNLLAVKTRNGLKLYRIFEEICSFDMNLYAFHPNTPIIAGYGSNCLQFHNLETETTTSSAIDEIYHLTWSMFYSHTLLLLAFRSHVQLRLNGQLPILHLSLGHGKIIHMNLLNDIVVTVQEPCVVNLTRLEGCSQGSLDRISYLSSLSKELAVVVEQIKVILDRLGVELKGLEGVYLKFGGILKSAFQEHKEKPTVLHWRRLMVLGDSHHDILVSIRPHLKATQGIQKELTAFQLKLSSSFQGLFEVLIKLKVSLCTVSECYRFIPSTKIDVAETKSVVDSITTRMTEYAQSVSQSITGLAALTKFIESALSETDYSFPTSAVSFFNYQSFSKNLFMTLVDDFNSIKPSILDSCRLSNDIPTNTKTMTLSGKFMNSFAIDDIYIATSEGCSVRLYAASGVEKSVTFPEQVLCCHYTKLGLLVLTNARLYNVDISTLTVEGVKGFESSNPVGITGNVGKGMIGVWSKDSIDIYDLVDSDEEEMEE